MKDKLLRIFQICFVAGMALIVFAGLGRAVFAPKEIIEYENRPAELLPGLAPESFLSAEYQNDFEIALADQVHGAEELKALYNETDTGISFSVLSRVFEANPDKVYKYNGLFVRNGDALVNPARALSEKAKTVLAARAEEINASAEANPEQEFYVYYIERDTDFNFNSGINCGYSEQLMSNIDTDMVKTGVDAVADYDDYYRRFYKTDHHWNHIGSYECYLELLPFLGVESEPIAIEGEFLVGSGFSGSKAAAIRAKDVWVEDMYGYYLNFPWMDVHMNGWVFENYGSQNFPDPEELNYGGYYGGDCGEVVLDLYKPERENILIIGDSFDNALLKLLASHFNSTHSIDLRYYKQHNGVDFVLDDYIEENDIDKVLIIGSMNFFLSEVFSVR